MAFNEAAYPEYNQNVNDDIYPDTSTQYKSPIVFRNEIPNVVNAMGLKVTNSRYDYLPQ